MLSFVTNALILFLLLVDGSTLRVPRIPPNDPRLESSLSPAEIDRLTGGTFFEKGFGNARALMSLALSDLSQDAIFIKYFNQEDRPFVNAVFNRLLGDNDHGNILLNDMSVFVGTPSIPNTISQLKDFETPNPRLLLTDDSFVRPDLDSAGYEYDGKLDPCRTWNDEGLSRDMFLLGSLILHEYVHWGWLLANLGAFDIDDQEGGYNIPNTRKLDHKKAKFNADSYAWWATENLWAITCGVQGGYDIL